MAFCIVDACGTCNGTIFDPNLCVFGCDGVFASNKTYDRCGVCDGNNSTCICDTIRILAFLMLAVGSVSFPIFMYAVQRLWVYAVPQYKDYLLRVDPAFEKEYGHGAFRRNRAQEARWGSAIWTIVYTAFAYITFAGRFYADWSSSSCVVCDRISLDTMYLAGATLILAACATIAMLRSWIVWDPKSMLVRNVVINR